jgi:predicted RNA binding protein YcfA (HicA-like mRNA interferase family)
LPKIPSLIAQQAESLLLKAGFTHIRSKGSHKIYLKENQRIVIPFHKGKMLHPKIVRQVLEAIQEH